jgi:hypothetical protein
MDTRVNPRSTFEIQRLVSNSYVMTLYVNGKKHKHTLTQYAWQKIKKSTITNAYLVHGSWVHISGSVKLVNEIQTMSFILDNYYYEIQQTTKNL